MRRECRERFPRHRLQRKPQVSDSDMHHGTCVTHVPWCISGSLTSGGGENVPGTPGACATCNFTYLVRGPCRCRYHPVNVRTNSDGCSASVSFVFYAISCYIGPCYNGTDSMSVGCIEVQQFKTPQRVVSQIKYQTKQGTERKYTNHICMKF